jgi:hypothetical protein
MSTKLSKGTVPHVIASAAAARIMPEVRILNMQQVTRVMELEEANALLRAELDTAYSKLVEVEHHEWTLTFKNEALKRDLEAMRTARDVAVRDKEVVQQAEQVKLQRF